MTNTSNEKPANQSVSKLLQLIANLSASKVPMRLQDIAEHTGIPQATCLRYLNALLQEGYAFQDMDSGRYSMTWSLCDLGEQIRAHRSLRSISSDVVNALFTRLERGICLVVEHEMECMYLDCLYESSSIEHTLVRIGKQTPLYASSSGKILLTGYSEQEIDRLIETKGLVSLTPKTISSREQLLAEIEKVRAQEFALDDEECESGLRCVAAPIYDYSGRVSAAISSFGSVERMTDDCIQAEILPALQKAAEELSFRMGSRQKA